MELLPSKCEALSSNSSITKTERGERERERERETPARINTVPSYATGPSHKLAGLLPIHTHSTVTLIGTVQYSFEAKEEFQVVYWVCIGKPLS
jgi:hypothetical protein